MKEKRVKKNMSKLGYHKERSTNSTEGTGIGFTIRREGGRRWERHYIGNFKETAFRGFLPPIFHKSNPPNYFLHFWSRFCQVIRSLSFLDTCYCYFSPLESNKFVIDFLLKYIQRCTLRLSFKFKMSRQNLHRLPRY